MPTNAESVQYRAIRVQRGDLPPIYQFALPLNTLLDVADVSRIPGVTLEQLVQYRRVDVRSAVDALAEVAKSIDFAFACPVTLALSSRLRFRQSRGPAVGAGTTMAGTLEFPSDKPATKKPCLVLDGQFALLAACVADRADLPIPIVGFVCDDELQLRKQFRSFTTQQRLAPDQADQLIPDVLIPTSAKLSAKEVPLVVCRWLNEFEKSPFHALIKDGRKSAGKQSGIIAAATVRRMVDESLSTPSGCLFPYRNIATGETDVEGICRLLLLFWAGVRNVFSDAWGKPPSRSRLMHPAGVRAMGRLMDRVMPTISIDDRNALADIEAEIQKVVPICRWTSGTWEELGIKWNDVQNHPRHIHMLSNALIRAYAQADRGSRQ